MQATEPIRNQVMGWCKRVVKWLLYSCLAYIAILLIGLIPVNNDFVAPDDGITLYMVSNAVHADIILPKHSSVVDWTDRFGKASFQGDTSSESHVAIGWGDRGFYLKTPTWNDLRLSIAANALLRPSESCVHVSFTRPEYNPDATAVTITTEQYAKLVDFISGTFKKDSNGDFMQIEGYAYSTTDAFFDAHGRYHLLNTCNSWVGRALKTTGVRVPWLTPLPKSPMLYIDSE